jgi:hypothetical protein
LPGAARPLTGDFPPVRACPQHLLWSTIWEHGHAYLPQRNMNIDRSLTDHLRQLEELLMQPPIRRSATELNQLLADDFREFGGSGRVFDKQQIIDALNTQPPCQLWLEEFQVTSLAPDVVLVTYRENGRFVDSEKVLHSLRSSIWRNENGRWKVMFHQGTPSGESLQGGAAS